MSDNDRINELVRVLNEASRSYYSLGKEIMTNAEYDKLYDELAQLEKETGIVLSNSPTVNVGYESLSSLPKERHASPMLSLDKTKSIEVLSEWAGNQNCVLSWKLDGLTVVISYENGNMVKAVTRGNGEVGDLITSNAKVFENVPLKIPFTRRLVLRGEALISYKDFERINEDNSEPEKYKNPRNLCSGAVRQLNNEITARRHVKWIVFSLVEAEGLAFNNSIQEQFNWLESLGFSVVEHKSVTADSMRDTVDYFSKEIENYPYPSDGLVITYDDIAYGISLGRTAKFPRNSLAFKWKDELETTILRKIEWSPSRTGLINPIAVFDPVELEQTTVSRASVHNISVMHELKLGIGDHIRVYKANMIIPQIFENIDKSDSFEVPDTCPVCGEKTELVSNNEVTVLYCPNSECNIKHVKAFSLFVSRNALNIDGLSDATLEKMLEYHIIETLPDLFYLRKHKETFINIEGLGEKSYSNIIDTIEKRRHVDYSSFLYGIGIPGIGIANARILARHFHDNHESLVKATCGELAEIQGIGDIMAKDIYNFFHNDKRCQMLDKLINELTFNKNSVYDKQTAIAGKTFVITGSLTTYENRDELVKLINSLNAKVSSSVSSKTDYLINNDSKSQSGKNKKAMELNIPIISEEEFRQMISEE